MLENQSNSKEAQDFSPEKDDSASELGIHGRQHDAHAAAAEGSGDDESSDRRRRRRRSPRAVARSVLKKVLKWAALHPTELDDDWRRARSGQPLIPIPPLP